MRVNSLFKYLTYRVFAPGAVLRKTYEAFQRLLTYDNHCHELMAELESYYYQGIKEDFCKIAKVYHALAENVEGMVTCLNQMAPASYHDLPAYFKKVNFYAGYFLEPPPVTITPPYVLSFTDKAVNGELAGSKTCRLIELRDLLGLNVPDGFVISTNCFFYFLEYNDLRSIIDNLLETVSIDDIDYLETTAKEIETLILKAVLPPEIEREIQRETERLQQSSATEHFAVRSSAVAEDGECSFAGQYRTCLNVPALEIIHAYKKVLASKYSPEALVYRISRGLYDTEAPMAVMVLPMIEAKAAGVMYTRGVGDKGDNLLTIHAAKGLGEQVVSGSVIPDIYCYDTARNTRIETHPLHRSDTEKFLYDNQIETIAKAGVKIEQHFSGAQDIEWAIDQKGKPVFLQTRPLAHVKEQQATTAEPAIDVEDAQILLQQGECGAAGIVTGIVTTEDNLDAHAKEEQNVILKVHNTPPSLVKILPAVQGVVAASGSHAGHFATVCREFNVPLLLGLGDAISQVEPGSVVTLDAGNRTIYEPAVQLHTVFIPVYKQEEALPFYRKLRSMLDFVTPLTLVDPVAKTFEPGACRSFHDIIRFCHEKAVNTMFAVGDQAGRTKGVKKKLTTSLPFDIFLVDIDQGIAPEAASKKVIEPDEIISSPFIPFWSGLTHPSIQWEEHKYYDWQAYDKMALSDAFAFQTESDSASYAILGKYYINVNIRFGYHFTVLDALSEPDSNANYCTLRFAGGGGEFEGRRLRITFLQQLLERLDFEVRVKGDLLDATLNHVSQKLLEDRLEALGRLLGVTKQLDMRLHEERDVEQQIEKFLHC